MTFADAGLAAEVESQSWFPGEPDWLQDRRQQAWKAFAQLPLPSWRRSQWWRTDLSDLNLASLESGVGAPTPEDSAERMAPASEATGLVIQHNSPPMRQQLRADLARRGVIFTDLETAVRQHPDLVRQYLGSLVKPTEGKLMALHAALWSGGTFLYVPAGVEVDLPLWVSFGMDTGGQAMFAHSIVVVEAGGRVTYVEEHSSPLRPGQALATAVTEVHVGRGAWVECVSLQHWGENVYHQAIRRTQAEADSWVRWTAAELGSRLTRAELEVRLAGQGASTEVRELFFARRSQHIDLVSGVHHQAAHTTSNTLATGVLADQSRASFEGLIKVHRGAQGTDAYLADNVLLLGEQAKSDSVPSLEVEANDVRASHGATVGPIDPDQLFYLMSRGLPRERAEAMIVEGFFEPVVRQVLATSIAAELQRLIREKMGTRE